MTLNRTKSNVNNESFHQRYSELSDEIRIKNKREDRLLDIRLKYYEREKNIRLNMIRKEQYHLECTRAVLLEQLNKIQHDKQKHLISSYLQRAKLESSLIQLSTPELFKTDWEPQPSLPKTEQIPPIPVNKPITSTKVIRPHSAG